MSTGRESLFDARDCKWCHGTGIHYYNTDDMDRLTMPCPNRNCPKSPDWWRAAAASNAEDRNPPYGDDSEPDNPEYEPIRLPWEVVEDGTDKALGQARVLNASSELVCTATPRRARLIVAVVNRHASGFDV